MNWLHLEALIFLFLIPVIVLFYFMKLRRKEIAVSSTFLWKKSISDAKVDSFFQKLRMNIMLLLQILFITLLACALARPYFKSLKNLPPTMIFIVDSSASMSTKEDHRSRFENARDRILSYVDGARRGTSFALITATTRAKMEVPFTPDAQVMRTALRNMEPGDTGTSLEPALLLATSLLKSHPDAHIFLFSDGGGDLPRIWPRYSSLIHYESIGSAGRNVGIIAFDVKEMEKRGSWQIFATVKNFSNEVESTIFSITIGNVLKEARELNLSPQEEKSYIFQISTEKGGVVEAHLDIKDSLMSDNKVFAVIPEARTKEIILIPGGNPFLEKLLALLPAYRVTKLSNPLSLKNVKAPDLVIWESVKVPSIPSGTHLFFNCSLPPGLIEQKGTEKNPLHISWDRNHPLTRFLDFSTLSIAEAQKLIIPPWGKVLVKSESCDLIVMLEKGTHRSLVVAFDPYRSDLFLTPVFPIFLCNTLSYLLLNNSQSSSRLVRTEESISLEDLHALQSLKVTLPSGRQTSLSVNDRAPFFSDTERSGVYTFKTDREQISCAVNLLDENESQITVFSPPLSEKPADKAGLSMPMITEYWKPLIFLALLLLLLEWSCFHRRRQ
ncbi:MAG: VWA domain-containing protein [Candidatus Xenobiia bacterium LiM19]